MGFFDWLFGTPQQQYTQPTNKAVVGGSGGNQQNGAFYGTNPNLKQTTGTITTTDGNNNQPYATTRPATTNPTNTSQPKPQPSGTTPTINNPNQGQDGGPSEIDMINQAFDAEQGYLGGLEGSARSNAGAAQGQIQSEAPQITQQLQNDQNSREADLNQRSYQNNLDYQSGVGKTKQVLNDLQRRNASQLALTGGYGSSSGEALAEAYGKQAQGSMGALENSRLTAQGAVNTSMDQVKNFYDNKKSEVQLNLQKGLSDIQSQLQDQLNKISGAKADSARAKASATMQAWQDYTNRRAQLNLAVYQFNQNLDAWANQKASTLSASGGYQVGQTPMVNQTAGVFDPSQASGLGVNSGTTSFNPDQNYSPVPISTSKTFGGSNSQDDYLAQILQQQKQGTLPSTISSGLA